MQILPAGGPSWARKASRRGWGEAAAPTKDWLILDPNDLAQGSWGLMDNAPSDAHRRLSALKLCLTSTAKKPMASDMRRRELVLAQMNPRSAIELAETVEGGSGDATRMGRAPREAAREVGLVDDKAPRGGPRNKMATIAARAASMGKSSGLRRYQTE